MENPNKYWNRKEQFQKREIIWHTSTLVNYFINENTLTSQNEHNHDYVIKAITTAKVRN